MALGVVLRTRKHNCLLIAVSVFWLGLFLLRHFRLSLFLIKAETNAYGFLRSDTSSADRKCKCVTPYQEIHDLAHRYTTTHESGFENETSQRAV